MRRVGVPTGCSSARSHNVLAIEVGLQITGTISSYVCVNTCVSNRLLVNSRRTSRGGFLPRLAPSMACPFSKVARRKPLTARDLRRLPSRSIPRSQPTARDPPFYRQPAFGNVVHAVYAAMTREIAKKGNDARFEKVDRGRFQIRKGA